MFFIALSNILMMLLFENYGHILLQVIFEVKHNINYYTK